MGCVSSEADSLPPKNKLVDEYIQVLRLNYGADLETRSYLPSKSQAILNSAGARNKLDPHDSPCCMVEVSFPSMKGKATWGTCSLINPIFVLTSATNVYSHTDNAIGQLMIKFYDKKQTKAEVARVFLPEAFRKGNLSENYALLLLHQPITQFGFFGLKVLPQPKTGMFLNMLAFPIPMNESPLSFKKFMEANRGMIQQVDNQAGAIIHNITPDSGVSGAGLYIVKNHLPYIVAIQSKRLSPDSLTAVLLTEPRLRQIREWTNELLTKQFERDTLVRIDFTSVEVSRDFY